MNLERFLREREPDWSRLRDLVGRANGRPERLGADGLRHLGGLYRAAAADLSFARRRWPSDPIVTELQSLVGRARQLVYDSDPKRTGLISFVATEYWRLVWNMKPLVMVAAVLLLAPGMVAGMWVVSDPIAGGRLVPVQFEAIGEHQTGPVGHDVGASEGAAFSSAIFTNNVQVSFLAFAGGIVAGLLTAYVLILNGVLLGAVAALAITGGNLSRFVRLVAPHGVLELSCIVVAAAAGLSIGRALVMPGHRPRLEALVEAARGAVMISLGTAPWLVLAGLVEGFVTPVGLGLVPATALGVALGGAYWFLLFRRGPLPLKPAQ